MTLCYIGPALRAIKRKILAESSFLGQYLGPCEGFAQVPQKDAPL